MGEENVLSGGTEILLEIRKSLQELEDNKSRAVALKNDEIRLEKEIAATEKSMNTEITNTVAKRRGEIESSYNGQISSIQGKIKKEKSKRDKEKSNRVSERIGSETENLRRDILDLKQKIKQVFDKNRIPKFFNNEFCFSVFIPNGLKDVLIMLATFAVAIIIPFVIYFLILPEESKGVLAGLLIFGGCIGLFAFVYGMIFSKIRVRYKEPLRTVQTYRSRIDGNKRRIEKIEKEIRSDKDESLYDLGGYDERIDQFEKQLDEILEDKKEALADFEDKKKQEIADDIKKRYSEKLSNAKTDYENTYNEQEEVDKVINESTVRISKTYEAYVGKEALNITTIDQMIEMIENGSAENIADALDRYKKNMISE